MTVRVEILGEKAAIRDYVWQCRANPTVEALLNSMLDPHGPSGADPDPDLNAAEAAVQKLGGKVVYADPVEYVPGRVY